MVIDKPTLVEALLYIDNKQGEVLPFKFNRMQRYFFQHKSNRNIVLKHRQGGFCVDPSTLILTADLRWVKLDDIQVGEYLVSVDEFPEEGKGKSRYFRKAIVQAKAEIEAESYLVKTDNGSIIVTGNHRLLSKTSGGKWNSRWRKIEEDSTKRKAGLKLGHKLRILVKPWGEPNYEDGWFGGILDGEGSLAKRRAQLKVSQKAGQVLERCKTYLRNWGKYHYYTEVGGYNHTPVDAIEVYGIPLLMGILGKCHPSRFISRTDWWEDKSLPHRSGAIWGTVLSITPLGKRRMLDLQTSTGTFIANGFISHNSSSILADMLTDCITIPHTQCAVVSHETRATQRLLDRVQFYYDTMADPKPAIGAESRAEKTFPDMHSSIYIGTAGCLHPDSSVLMEGGNVKAVKDIRPGDRIYSGRGRNLQTIDQLIIKPYSGKLLKFITEGNPSEPLIVTPEHRFMVHKDWQTAEHIVSPTNSRGKRVFYFIKPVRNRIKEIGGIHTDYELGWIFGLYMAEGWYGGAYISFGLNLNEIEYRDKIISFAEKKGFTSRWRQHGGIGNNGMEVSIGSVSFMKVIEEVFGKEKKVPDWFWDCGKDFLNGIIDGYIAGDGSEGLDKRNKSKTKVTSVRPHLLYQLRDMLLSVRDIYSGIYKLQPREGFGGVQQLQWELDFPITRGIKIHQYRKSSKGKQYYRYISIPIKYEELKYTGLVYDISCGESFSTPSCLIHNSRAFGHGDTIRKALMSELSLYEDGEKILNGVEDAVPLTGEITIECTPNGEGNVFYDKWTRAKEGKSPYKTFFFPWWWSDDYTIPRGCEFVLPMDKEELNYTGEELDLIERFHVNEDQIRWRRWKIGEKGGLFWQEYPEDEVSCFITIGDPVFDQFILTSLAQNAYNGDHHAQGWTFWIPPQKKMDYVIGADSSAGVPGGSYSAAVVLDNNFQICATFQARIEPYVFAGILKDLGKWYNNAEIAVERNFTGYAVLSHMTDYGNIYHQRDFVTGRVTTQRGWWTDDKTRPYMMTKLKDSFTRLKIWDINLIRQLRGFRYIKLRATAQTFDDLAIALMIANAVKAVQGVARGYRGHSQGWSW